MIPVSPASGPTLLPMSNGSSAATIITSMFLYSYLFSVLTFPITVFQIFGIVSEYFSENTDNCRTGYTDKNRIIGNSGFSGKPFPQKFSSDCHYFQQDPYQCTGNSTNECTEQPQFKLVFLKIRFWSFLCYSYSHNLFVNFLPFRN